MPAMYKADILEFFRKGETFYYKSKNNNIDLPPVCVCVSWEVKVKFSGQVWKSFTVWWSRQKQRPSHKPACRSSSAQSPQRLIKLLWWHNSFSMGRGRRGTTKKIWHVYMRIKIRLKHKYPFHKSDIADIKSLACCIFLDMTALQYILMKADSHYTY